MLLLNIHIDAHLDYVQIKVRTRNSQVIFNSRFFALAFEIVKRILHYKKNNLSPCAHNLVPDYKE